MSPEEFYLRFLDPRQSVYRRSSKARGRADRTVVPVAIAGRVVGRIVGGRIVPMRESEEDSAEGELLL